jgi:hypothetical protein
MRLVAADLNDRMMVANEPATGRPNVSSNRARRAVPLQSVTMIPWKCYVKHQLM